eukprot:5197254-Lingulodinium_polyedra.AAC.1
MIGAQGHDFAVWAGAPEPDALRDLHDPVRGVAEHLVLHVLDQPGRVPALAEVLQDAVDALDRS